MSKESYEIEKMIKKLKMVNNKSIDNLTDYHFETGDIRLIIKTTKEYALKIVDLCDKIEEYKSRESILQIYNNGILPVTEEKFDRFQQAYNMSITELNNFFKPFGLEFRKYTINSVKTEWYKKFGIEITENMDIPKNSKPFINTINKGITRIVRYKYLTLDIEYIDTVMITEVICNRIPDSDKNTYNKQNKIEEEIKEMYDIEDDKNGI